jgi:integrase
MRRACRLDPPGHRDALMVLLTHRHGFRLGAGRLQSRNHARRRAKNGTSATHPLSGREMRELRPHQRESPSSPFVFVSQCRAPLSSSGFSRMVERAAEAADMGIKAHAHKLRHACGYKLTNDGRERSRPISAIAIFRIRRAIPRWRRSGSRIFFRD